MQIDRPQSLRPGISGIPGIRGIRGIRVLLVGAAIAAGALVAGSTAEAADAVRTTPPDTTPVTTPDTTPVTTPDTVPDNGDDSDVPWGWIIAIIAVGIAIIALVAGSTGRRSSSTAATAAPPPRPSTADQDRGYALGSAQWVHDHLAPDLLVAPPDQAAQRWATERSRVDDTVIRCQVYTTDPSTGAAWQQLSQSLALLGTSLDSYIQLRNQQPPNQQKIDEAYAVAYQHHSELGIALSQVWPTIQR